MFYLTDGLLGCIEDNTTWKVAFGFDKGDETAVKNGGKKLVEHYQKLAKQLLVDDISGRWDDGDLKKLGDSVKNRIHTYVCIRRLRVITSLISL